MGKNLLAVVGAGGLFLEDRAADKAVMSSEFSSSTGNGGAFSPDGTKLAMTSGSALVVFNTGNWTRYTSPNFTLPGTGYGCVFSADGAKLLVAHGNGNNITVLNTSDWSYDPAGPVLSSYSRSLDISPSGDLVAVGYSVSPYLAIYSSPSWVKVTTAGVTLTGLCLSCKFSPDGTKLAATTGLDVYIYDTATWTKITTPNLSLPGNGRGVAFNPSGTKLAVAHDNGDGVKVFNTADWTVDAAAVMSVSGAGTSCCFSPDGLYLAVTSSLIGAGFRVFMVSDWSVVAQQNIAPSAGQSWTAYAEFGSRHLRGTVRDEDGMPAARTVRVRERATGTRQAETVSDALTGDFEVAVYAGDVEYDVQVMIEPGELLNDLFFARATSSPT